jgi:hypothetical protein
MGSKKVNLDDIELEVTEVSKDAFNDLQITTSKIIVRRWIEALTFSIGGIKQYKQQAIERGYGHGADKILYFQCVLSSLLSLYKVVLYLKEEDNHKAWASLIDAEDYLKVCTSFMKKYPPINEGESHGLDGLYMTTENFANLLFPKHALFNSPGMIESIGVCSVCSLSFILCEHVEECIYDGIYCQRVDREILEVNHMALVEFPRDRRCIINTRHDKDGYMIDVFSRERVEGQDAPAPDKYQSVVLNIKGIDVN